MTEHTGVPPIRVEVVADSLSPFTDLRLTTIAATYHRYIHSELMTHRAFSRNAASSRAIPIAKWLEQVREAPAMPIEWRKNGAGMQPGEPLSPALERAARNTWLNAAEDAAKHAERLAGLGLHKQWTNRLLEPFQFITTIITATDWANFFAQRIGGGAQAEFEYLAKSIRAALAESTPVRRAVHLPYVTDAEAAASEQDAVRYCVARCARISYLRHATARDRVADGARHDDLWLHKHLSPFEHPALALPTPRRQANFQGWRSYRYCVENDLPFVRFTGHAHAE